MSHLQVLRHKPNSMWFLDILLPWFCVLCEKRARGPVCDDCRPNLGWVGSDACRRCGAPGAMQYPCRECSGKPMRTDSCCALLCYTTETQKLILRMKYESGAFLADYFGRMLAERVRAMGWTCDVVTFVPSDRWSFFRRGYCATEQVARNLGDALGLPTACLLRKARWVPPQKGLARPARLTNPKGAYVGRERIDGIRTLLVDDVLTTGATMSVCADALRKAGASRVYGAVVSRG